MSKSYPMIRVSHWYRRYILQQDSKELDPLDGINPTVLGLVKRVRNIFYADTEEQLISNLQQEAQKMYGMNYSEVLEAASLVDKTTQYILTQRSNKALKDIHMLDLWRDFMIVVLYARTTGSDYQKIQIL